MSYAGIKPGTNLVRPPPTCAASFPDLVHDNDPLQVRFGATPWSSVQSYVGFKLDNVVMKRYFTSRLVLVNYYLVTGNLFLKVAKEWDTQQVYGRANFGHVSTERKFVASSQFVSVSKFIEMAFKNTFWYILVKGQSERHLDYVITSRHSLKQGALFYELFWVF